MFTDFKTAKEYINSIEKVEDAGEAKKRRDNERQAILKHKPIISSQINAKTRLELDLEDVEDDEVDSVINAFQGLIFSGGAGAVAATEKQVKINLEKVSKNQRPAALHYFNHIYDQGGWMKVLPAEPVAASSTSSKSYGSSKP